MRKDAIYIAIIVLLLGFVVVMMCTAPPEPVEDTRKYDSLIRVSREGEAKAKKLTELRISDSLETIQTKKSYDLLQKSSVAQIAYYKAHPKVIEIIKTVPVIDSAFRAYDSAIVIRDERIAELSGELYDCQKLAINAEENFQVTMQAYQGANAELLEDVKGYKKDLKKKNRGVKFWKAAAVTLGIGGLLVGANL